MENNAQNGSAKVAVIVPVYNVERYLPQCLDSLLNQTLKDIEIICVNDVSPDNSAHILAEYEAKDPRVKVVTHEVNQGLGPARNSGVAATKAPYIAFVDSDDYVKPRMMESLYEAITEHEADLAWCGMAKVSEEGALIEKGTIPAEVITPQQALADLRFYPSIQVVCNKLYKREILKDIKQLRILIEDEPTNAQYLSRINKIVTVSESFYQYRDAPDSLSNPSDHSVDYWDDFFKDYRLYFSILKEHFEEKVIRKQVFLRHFAALWRIDHYDLFRSNSWGEQRDLILRHLKEDAMLMKKTSSAVYSFLVFLLSAKMPLKIRKQLLRVGMHLTRRVWINRASWLLMPFDILKAFWPTFKKWLVLKIDSVEIGFYRLLGGLYRAFNKDVWIVGERSDTAQENGIYFFRYLREHQPQEKCFYPIDPNCEPAKEVAKVGPTLKFNGFWHKLLFCASKYYVTSHNHYCKPLASFGKTRYGFSSQTENVFLDHGITYADVSEFYGKAASGIDLFICGAKPEYDFVGPGFGYKPEEVAYTGFARFDGLHDFQVKKQILVMPTWRRDIYENKIGNNHDFFKESDYYKTFQRLISDQTLLAELEKHDYELVFYPHYEIQHYLDQFTSENPRVILASKDKFTVQQLLKDAALLIVDTSSVNFDFAYMFKPLIYYRFDKKSFTSGHLKPGYFKHETMGFGEIVEDHEELIPLVQKYLESGCEMSEEYRKRTETFYPLHDRKNCERIYHASLKKGAHGK